MVLEVYYDIRCSEEGHEVAVAVAVAVVIAVLAMSSAVVDERESVWLIYAMTMMISVVVIVPPGHLTVVSGAVVQTAWIGHQH